MTVLLGRTHDISIWLRQFLEEPESPAAHRLLEAHADGTAPLVAPDLLVYEVANVLLHNPAFRVLDTQRSIERLYDLELELIAPSAELVTATVELAAAKGVTFYDALYVQLASHLDLPLYTADRKLALKLHGLRHIKLL